MRYIWVFVVLAAFPAAALSQEETFRTVALAEAEQAALKIHPSIRLADEETALSAFKRKESFRAVWPSLTVKGEQTFGESVERLGTPDFEEKSYGVQASQPLVQGGKLYRTYRQARATWEVQKAKGEKARQEVVFGVREAHWNYVKTLRMREAHLRARADLEKELSMAEKLSKQGVIPRQVHLTINSQQSQAALAADGAEAEMTARLWQWTAALGLNSPPEYRPSVEIPNAKVPEILLEECIKAAEGGHPDLRVQEKTLEAARYGHKAARGLYWPKLSASGFYGRSGGAFEGERLELREDWNAGLQLSQYFGGNTVNVNGQQVRTSPKIGQTTRTESKTVSGNVGILDGMKQVTEKKDAALTFHQAEVQMERTRMEVANGVREAYANWKKALASLKIAENDLSLARTDFSIARIKSAHREVPLSERAVSRNKLAQAEVALADAQAGYQIAAAALSRAVGAPDFFERKIKE